jgi:hypothetical protein
LLSSAILAKSSGASNSSVATPRPLSLRESLVLPRIACSNFLDIILRYFLCFHQLGENGKLRTNEATETTFYTIFCMKNQFWRVIPLDIEAFALFQTTVGTKFDAETAPFASVIYNVNGPVWYRVRLSI